jgi:hypothetical protein
MLSMKWGPPTLEDNHLGEIGEVPVDQSFSLDDLDSRSLFLATTSAARLREAGGLLRPDASLLIQPSPSRLVEGVDRCHRFNSPSPQLRRVMGCDSMRLPTML